MPAAGVVVGPPLIRICSSSQPAAADASLAFTSNFHIARADDVTVRAAASAAAGSITTAHPTGAGRVVSPDCRAYGRCGRRSRVPRPLPLNVGLALARTCPAASCSPARSSGTRRTRQRPTVGRTSAPAGRCFAKQTEDGARNSRPSRIAGCGAPQARGDCSGSTIAAPQGVDLVGCPRSRASLPAQRPHRPAAGPALPSAIDDAMVAHQDALHALETGPARSRSQNAVRLRDATPLPAPGWRPPSKRAGRVQLGRPARLLTQRSRV